MIKQLAVFTALCSLLALNFLESYRFTDAVFVVVGLVAFYFNRNHPNITGLLIIIVAFRALEIAIWMVTPPDSAYKVYPIQLAIDLAVIYCIHNRWRFYLMINKNATPKDIVFTNADYFLIQVYICYTALVFFSLVEHLVRHPYDIGLPADWALPQALNIYNNIHEIKFFLSYWQFAIILLTAHRYLRSPRIVHA